MRLISFIFICLNTLFHAKKQFPFISFSLSDLNFVGLGCPLFAIPGGGPGGIDTPPSQNCDMAHDPATLLRVLRKTPPMYGLGIRHLGQLCPQTPLAHFVRTHNFSLTCRLAFVKKLISQVIHHNSNVLGAEAKHKKNTCCVHTSQVGRDGGCNPLALLFAMS